MPSRLPVGFFDSGIGGVSVLKEALKLMPNEDYIFYGDNLNAPYGDKSEAQINKLAFDCARFLASMNVKALVVACNTATSAAINDIRASFTLPVISMEPAIKPACKLEGSGKVIMMATEATTKLSRYLELQSRMPDPGRIINVACPGLVDRIEQGVFNSEGLDDLLERYLGGYSEIEIDAIVLGCTHYVFIKDVISDYARRRLKGACRLFDGNLGTVKRLQSVLESKNLLNDCGCGHVRFFTSGNEEYYRPLFEMLMRQ